MASLGNIFLKFGADTSGLSSGIKSVDNQLKGFSSSVKALGGVLGGVFAATSIAGFAGDAIKMSAGIETAFLKIKNLTDTTANDLQYFKKGIAGISTQVGRSQQQLADGLYTITSGGLVGKEAMDALTVASKASAVGLGEVDVVARALTNVLNAYGKENITAARAAEILFNALKLGNLEATELAPALSKVLPVSSALGISMEQVAAFISQASLSGASASESVTELTSVLDALIKPSQEAEDVLASVGLTMSEVRDVAKKDLAGALNLLYERFGQNEEAMGRITGRKEGFVGFYSVVGDRAENYAKILDGVSASTDNLGDAHREAAKSSAQRWAVFSAQMANVKAAVGDALISLINQLLPQSKEGVDKLNAALAQLPGIAEKIGEKFAVIVSVLKEMFVIAEKLHLYDVLIRPLVEVDNLLSGPKEVKISTDEALSKLDELQEYLSDGTPVAGGIPYVPPKKTPTAGSTDTNTENENLKKQFSIIQQLTAARDKLVTTMENHIAAGRETAVIEQKIISLNQQIEEITKLRDEALSGSLPVMDELLKRQSALNDELTNAVATNQDYSKIEAELLDIGQQIASIERTRASVINNITEALYKQAQAEANLKKVQATTLATGALNEKTGERGFNIAPLKEEGLTLPDVSGFEEGIRNQGDSLVGWSDRFAESLGVVGDAFAGIGSQASAAFGDIAAQFATGELAFKDLGKAALDAGRKIIQAALAEALAGIIAKSIGKLGLIGIGVALAGIVAVKGLFSKNVPRLAKGAISTGEHLAVIGDNPNARFDPEVTAPSSKLKKLFQDITLPNLEQSYRPVALNRSIIDGIKSFELHGELVARHGDLVAVIEKAEAVRKRQRGF